MTDVKTEETTAKVAGRIVAIADEDIDKKVRRTLAWEWCAAGLDAEP